MGEVKYYEAIDCVTGELERRFHQKSVCFVRNIETMLISCANGNSYSFPDTFEEIYAKDIDM